MLFESAFVTLLAACLASANSGSIWSTTDQVFTTSQWSTTDRVITTSQWSTTDWVATTCQWATTDCVITTSKTIKPIPVPTGNYSTVCLTPGINATTTPGNFTSHPNATKTTTKPILTTTDTTFTTSNEFTTKGTAVGVNLASLSVDNGVPFSSQSNAARRPDLNLPGLPLLALGLSLVCNIGASSISLS